MWHAPQPLEVKTAFACAALPAGEGAAEAVVVFCVLAVVCCVLAAVVACCVVAAAVVAADVVAGVPDAETVTVRVFCPV